MSDKSKEKRVEGKGRMEKNDGTSKKDKNSLESVKRYLEEQKKKK